MDNNRDKIQQNRLLVTLKCLNNKFHRQDCVHVSLSSSSLTTSVERESQATGQALFLKCQTP